MKTPITIPGCTPASGSAMLCEKTYAVNGFDCCIFQTDNDCCIKTRRPYSFISSFCACGGLLAVTDCSNRIYILNDRFEEIDSISPATNSGPLQSVYLCNGSGNLVLTYRDAIFASDLGGQILSTISTATTDIDYISAIPLCNGILLAYTNGGRDTIKYNACTNTLPACVRVKSFLEDGNGEVYALVGKGYPYTFLIPVFQDGLLSNITL